MEIKFDVYFKKNLGTLFKNNEVDLDGIPAHTNLDLNLVDRLEVNYKVGTQKYTDSVSMVDIEERVIQIPFKSDVVKVGLNEFEIVAYMLNGDIKTSQTYTYNIDEAIGEGVVSGGSGDGHSHTNLAILNSITQSKINEWNNKANKEHTHSDYAEKNHTHNANEIEGLENIDIDLSDYYTKSETYNKTEIDSKIANMGTGGSVDLSNYYTKSETDEAMNDKANKVHTHNEYLKELPSHEHSEYLTELPSHKHEQYLTEHQDISHKADKSDIYTRVETDNKIGNKTYKYLTQSEYDLLSSEEKNNESIVYFITDAKEDVFTLSLVGNTLSLLKNGISISSVVIPTSSVEGDSVVKVESINLNESTCNMRVDEAIQLTYAINPSNATNQNVTWSANNSNCIVENGLVTAKNVGECLITVTTEDGSKTSTCNIVVEANVSPEPPDEDVEFINYIYNSDTFQNPTSGNAVLKGSYYMATDCSMSVQDNVMQLTKSNDVGASCSFMIRHGFADGNLYYVQYKINSNVSVVAGSQQANDTFRDGTDGWKTISYTYTDSYAYSYACKIDIERTVEAGGTCQIKEPMKINLTELYGSGNEPSKEECDNIFKTYKVGLIG